MIFCKTYRFILVCSWIAVLLLGALSAHGQRDTSSHWSVMVSAQGGFIIPHHESVNHLIQGHSKGAHIYLFKNTDGSKYWHHAYNFPECGIDFTAIHSGNIAQLGSQYSSSYLVNLPLNGNKPFSDLRLEGNHGFCHWIGLGIGLGYSTQRWDLETNHQAPMLGSRMNAAISLQYSVRLASLRFGEFRAGMRILHFSNGAFQLPNLGANNAGIFLSYVTSKQGYRKLTEPVAPSIEKYLVSVGLVTGLKEILPPNGQKYAVSVLSLLGEKRVSYKSSFGVGADVLFDSSSLAAMEGRTGVKPDVGKAIQVGGVLSYSLFFDRLSFKMQQGYYLRDNFRLNGALYHRFGLRYRIAGGIFAQLSLKTHFAKADYGEIGIGYNWRR